MKLSDNNDNDNNNNKHYNNNNSHKWYNHVSKPVLESEKSKVLWDFKIQTDKQIEANKPDVVLLDKEERKCFIIDIACPFDTRIGNKQKKKVEN